MRRSVFVVFPFLLLSSTFTVFFSWGFSPSAPLHHQQHRQEKGSRRETTRSKLSATSNDDTFMTLLQSRIDEVAGGSSTKLPLVVLDSMLPGQTLKINVRNSLFIELIRTRIEQENPCFGMLGYAKLKSGEQEQVILKNGVEVHFESSQLVVEAVDKDDDGDGDKGGIQLVLKAGRRFCIEDGEVENAPQGWTEGRVQFLDSEQQEQDELKQIMSTLTTTDGGTDRMSLARAMRQAREFSSPNAMMEDNQSLVDRWVELAKQKERHAGQVDQLLEELGEMPTSEEPSERAFWIGALINPIPALGVATEIRPALLTAQTAEERVRIALNGILHSIQLMDGSTKPMGFD